MHTGLVWVNQMFIPANLKLQPKFVPLSSCSEWYDDDNNMTEGDIYS